ncbi:MAG: 3-deoxy-8-phosphooctulonate synthase [Burkholderiales bacterium 21-58-4]|nr:MAG: 3-deoxy-8-phosphooctulonate synthase [Burkholderiales bacterium 21-58-4]
MKLCGFEVGLDRPFFLIAGPCVIESRQMAFDTAGRLVEITRKLGIPFIYKSSFDKANRSSGLSYRGPGINEGLQILADVRADLGVPVLTDVHDIGQIPEVAAVVDVLQTPAFLCRQTDFIHACAASGKPVNIKKGCPVVFDATHSVQLPGGQGTSSGGQREFVPVLARAAVAVGVAGVFMETHPKPAEALSDGPNAVPLEHMEALLESLMAIDRSVKKSGFIEDRFN